MFDSETFGPEILANSGSLQRKILLDLEERSNGAVTIADPNNGFCYLADMGASVFSQYVRLTERRFDTLYPKRADSAVELQAHMSDFDYLHLTANPAETSLRLLLDRDYLLANAKAVSSEYRQAILPANTVFTIGARQFMLYYPVVIKANIRSGHFTIIHDTSLTNPLKTLATDLITPATYTLMGVNILDITLPVAQLACKVVTETLTPELGFNKEYAFTDKFCMVRASTKLGNSWVNLAQTMSEDIYDRREATLKLVLRADEQKLTAQLPQVYFTKGLIGNQLRLEIYTTEGEVDLTLTQAEMSDCKYAFDANDPAVTDFSSVLIAPPFVALMPTTAVITGGSNGLSFAELRDRVVNGSLYKTAPTTPLDLANYVSDAGFVLTSQLDNITNRVKFANRRLVDSAERNVPVTMASIQLDTEQITKVASIRSFSDKVVTVLPTTLYKYANTGNLCIPVADDELAYLGGLAPADLVTVLNDTGYTRSPFHLCLYRDDRYPIAKSYNLQVGAEPVVRFIAENVNSALQMSVAKALLIHQGHGTGGYILRFGVTKTTDLASVDESLISVLVQTTDRIGRKVHLYAERFDASSVYTFYQIELPTDYHISSDGYLRTTMLAPDDSGLVVELPLSCTFDVRFYLNPQVSPSTSNDSSLMGQLPTALQGYLALSHQQVTATLGVDMSNGLNNNTEAIWRAEEYVTWADDVYYTYEADVYKTKVVNGLEQLDYAIVDGELKVEKLHSKGDFILDPEGEKVLRYAKGTVRLDAYGKPIIAKERRLVHYVEAIQFDGRLYASQDDSDVAFVSEAADLIVSYVATVAGLADGLLEQTKLYFRPIRSMGTAEFSLGGGKTGDLDLGLAYLIKYYVTPAVLANDELKKVMTRISKDTIEEMTDLAVISLTEMSNELKRRLGSNIISVDVLGINGEPTLQTLAPIQADTKPMVARKLVVRENGQLGLERDIAIEYSLLE